MIKVTKNSFSDDNLTNLNQSNEYVQDMNLDDIDNCFESNQSADQDLDDLNEDEEEEAFEFDDNSVEELLMSIKREELEEQEGLFVTGDVESEDKNATSVEYRTYGTKKDNCGGPVQSVERSESPLNKEFVVTATKRLEKNRFETFQERSKNYSSKFQLHFTDIEVEEEAMVGSMRSGSQVSQGSQLLNVGDNLEQSVNHDENENGNESISFHIDEPGDEDAEQEPEEEYHFKAAAKDEQQYFEGTTRTVRSTCEVDKKYSSKYLDSELTAFCYNNKTNVQNQNPTSATTNTNFYKTLNNNNLRQPAAMNFYGTATANGGTTKAVGVGSGSGYYLDPLYDYGVTTTVGSTTLFNNDLLSNSLCYGIHQNPQSSTYASNYNTTAAAVSYQTPPQQGGSSGGIANNGSNLPTLTFADERVANTQPMTHYKTEFTPDVTTNSMNQMFSQSKYAQKFYLYNNSQAPVGGMAVNDGMVKNSHEYGQLNNSFSIGYPSSRSGTIKRNRSRDFKCNFCGKAFFTQSCLKSHTKIHTRKPNSYVCKYDSCDKRYSTSEGLRLHMRNHHEVDKKWVCPAPECRKSFVRQSDMRLHVMRMHTERRPFPCRYEHCSKTFACHSELKRHESSHAKRRKKMQN